MVALWVVSATWFWHWWLQPDHVIGLGRFLVVTLPLAWVYFLQLYFVYFLLRAVRSAAPDPAPGQYRVAMIVTKTPSEPFSVLEPTLRAMLAQDYPHDTWLADEDPSPETLHWCQRHGVRVSTRKGRTDYHRATWPRRTRCKEGNLAFFYDHWGYRDYDIVSQLDADHVPQPGYLREMLRPFADPAVGYVSAPSICATNYRANWAARTRLDTEAAFHGVLQCGYSNGYAPMCIGSHYAVRTRALREAGGLGPELAEDHSTTMLMNAAGWRGVHAIDAIAIGDGPATVADMATQEFQWSRSLVSLFLTHSLPYVRRMPWKLQAQFLFCQLFYVAFALSLLSMYLSPIVAVLTDQVYVDVTFPAYALHTTPTVVVLVAIAWMIRADGLFRPMQGKIFGWEKMLFVLLQWPWVLAGVIMAVRDRLTGRFVDFRITPKGEAARGRLPFRMLVAYGGLALGAILPVLAVPRLQTAAGFYMLSLVNGAFYLLILTITVLRHFLETGWPQGRRWLDAARQAGVVVLVAALFFVGVRDRLMPSLFSLSEGLAPIQILRAQAVVSGAANGDERPLVYFFDFAILD